MKTKRIEHRIAKYLGISPSHWCEFCSGKKNFSDKQAKKIQYKIGIDHEFLLNATREHVVIAIRAYVSVRV